MQSLNLKNPEAHKLASQLAQLTGESLTTTVIQAVEMRLAAEQCEDRTHNVEAGSIGRAWISVVRQGSAQGRPEFRRLLHVGAGEGLSRTSSV